MALPLSSDDIKSGHTDAKIVRTGKSQLEQRALQRFRIEVASVPASTIVQLCMWPETLADWARRVPISPSVVFNALAGRRIYRRVRDNLAERLDVQPQVLDQLIDRRLPTPVATGPPVPRDDEARSTPELRAYRARTWAHRPRGVERPYRDGKNALELKAVARVEQDLAALPASILVKLFLFPDTIAR